ncbi:MAG: hypothetical protein WDN28_14300 [Chthoniobacter sp.]
MSGTSIFGTSANENIDNFGTVNDSIDLGTGTNTFKQQAGALLQSGDYIKLGAGNVLNDAGTISTGGIGVVQTTNLTGDFALTGDARWTFDLTPAFSSDLFAISGTANLGSFVNRVDLNELGIANAPGTYNADHRGGRGSRGIFSSAASPAAQCRSGSTFDLVNSPTQEQLTLSPSTGPFYWRGTVDSTWNGAFPRRPGQLDARRGGQHVHLRHARRGLRLSSSPARMRPWAISTRRSAPTSSSTA